MTRKTVAIFVALGLAASAGAAERPERADELKEAAVAQVGEMARLTQVMVDKIFSFGELGFQEFETSRYLVALLREHGFTVEEGIAGIPTAWMASWGSGKPVIAFGSDIDGIPKASQKPGVAYHEPLVEGAPGHGEGHNSGQAVNATAAIVLKRILELLDPELVAKAWDYFKNEQTKDHQYTPFITENDPPPIFLNRERMESFRSEMKKYIYDETKYDTYLEQLGITYPTVREETKKEP
jgi:aminobenzoyl-glutamate utilization protein B